MKRLLAMILSMILITALLPGTALAGTRDLTVLGGTEGGDYTYENNVVTITANANLTISGNTAQDRILVNPGVQATVTLSGVDIDLSGAADGAAGCPFYIGDGATVTLSLDDSTNNALTAGMDNAGVRTGSETSLTIQGTGSLTAKAGQSSQIYLTSAGIGGSGSGKPYGTITINGGTIHAVGTRNGAGIGGGCQDIGGSIHINGGSITAISSDPDDNTNGGSGVGSGYGSTAPASVEITAGTVVATGGSCGAGLGAGGFGQGFSIVIRGGSVTANSRAGSAIGSGCSSFGGSLYGGTVTILGGTVNATAVGNYGGAGIGGNKNCSVTIQAGNITATGAKQAAGIGSGYNGSNGADGRNDGGAVSIGGGTVSAIGDGGGGIGGGLFGKGGTITISGGSIMAIGNAGGAGIGGGSSGAGGSVAISGGTVHATCGSNAQPIGYGQWGSGSGTLTNGQGDPAYLTEVSLGDSRGNAINRATGITSLTVKANTSAYTYGITDVSTDSNGKLYFYLPQGAVTSALVTQEPANYFGSIQTASGGSTGVIRLESAPEIDTTDLPDAKLGSSYTAQIAHIGSAPITWSVSADHLPKGLSLDTATGTISGTPTTDEGSTAKVTTVTFTVKAENNLGSDEQTLSITVNRPDIVISDKDFQDHCSVNVAYSSSLKATGLPVITWSVLSGKLPNGVVLHSDGTFSGTPTQIGRFDFTVQATNGTETSSKTLSLMIDPVITTDSLPTGTVGTPYSHTLSAPGVANPQWFIFGNLPDGLSLNESSGVISGTPAKPWDDLILIYVTSELLSRDNIYGATALRLTIKSPVIYKVTLDPQGGSVSPTSINVTGTSTYGTLPTPTRTGYTFGGWYTAANGAGTQITAATKVTITANQTIYAKWTAKSYTVTFNTQGGSTVASKTAQYNTTITAPTTPTRTGYTFVGWYKQSACTTTWNFATDKVTANTTIYAKWVILNYTISATANSTSYGSVTGNGSYAYGTSVVLKAIPKAGYRFVRWLEGTTAVSTAAEYKFAAVKSRTLKAEFAKIGTPAITAASAGYTSIKLTWAAVPGAKEYEIYRANTSGGTYRIVSTTTDISYTNTGLTTNTAYYFKVRVKCIAGSTITYGSYSAIVSAKPVPAFPATIKAASASSSSIKVTWSAVPGTTKYEVCHATSSTGIFTKLYETTALSYTNTALTTGKVYYYKVRAYRVVDGAKVYGRYSAIVSAKPIK